ncbi:MAG: polyprenyl synthetase family protein [Sedimentisphaerales bacterium]|nr:polyprenyl synthetase family protein [Sedimentisphaerales bacterium]MBN2843375.1 polyprenyl synthetase family protein [Sedimentisphaerales bacterium]
MTEFFDPIISGHLQLVRDVIVRHCSCDLPEAAELMRYVTNNTSGKMIRPALLLITGQGLGNLQQDHYSAAAVIEMMHIASLLHDDVLDNAQYRRDMHSANAVFGNKTAILMGDLMVSCALKAAMDIESRKGLERTISALFLTCQGELAQQRNAGNFQLSQQQYLQIITNKTAIVMACSMWQGALLAGADDDCCSQAWDAGLGFGVAFQIMDDIRDIITPGENGGKTAGTDFLQGKLTLPLIHHISNTSPDVIDWLKAHCQDTYDDNMRNELISRLDQTASLDYARNQALEYMQKCTDFTSQQLDGIAVNEFELLCGKVLLI